jgi:diguanylate cyclase (GGDEF)-like protein
MEFEKAKRGSQELSLFILDIDHFKKINDVYGHIQADKLLEQLAKILTKIIRKSDILARFGGEEFIILFPETNIRKAKEVTSRIRDAIKEDKLLRNHKLTVSGGLTKYIKKDSTNSMLKRADKALYDAKESGRDRLIAIGLNENGEFNIKEKSCNKTKKIKKINKKKLLNELKRVF